MTDKAPRTLGYIGGDGQFVPLANGEVFTAQAAASPPSVDALQAAWTKHRVVANLRRVHGDCDEDCAGDILARLTDGRHFPLRYRSESSDD